ncbi:MAG: hypothetical protein Terrestrivirus12_36 [Terrestrivirus sp.]|uniref:Uncharacterized protein n=1 Tax=Terrestrivirus sp. TaxID=2487775 RepID=A0A3G4ZT05_9VIRU|nr:MAG: hypothetical protein Terrestrivirus12_36 [Terrestrivirus sp.]
MRLVDLSQQKTTKESGVEIVENKPDQVQKKLEPQTQTQTQTQINDS